MSFLDLSSITSTVSDFVSNTWDMVESGAQAVTDTMFGQDAWAGFAGSWDSALGVDMFDADNKLATYNAENLLGDMKPPSNVYTAPEVPDQPLTQPVTRAVNSAKGLIGSVEKDTVMKIGGSMLAGYAKAEIDRKAAKQLHKDRLIEYTKQAKLNRAPVLPWK